MSSLSSICVDASLVLRLLVGNPMHQVVELWSKWQRENRSLIAPSLLYYEVTNALHRYVVQGHLISSEADALLVTALDLDIALQGDALLHQQALSIAKRFALPAAYDSHYLALAERSGGELWTADQRLYRSVHAHLKWVHLLGN